MSDADDIPTGDVLRPFSPADIVKVYAATFLPLCDILAKAGIVSTGQIARAIAVHAPPSETEPWAQLTRALVDALEAQPVTQETPQHAPPSLTVVPGGRP